MLYTFSYILLLVRFNLQGCHTLWMKAKSLSRLHYKRTGTYFKIHNMYQYIGKFYFQNVLNKEIVKIVRGKRFYVNKLKVFCEPSKESFVSESFPGNQFAFNIVLIPSDIQILQNSELRLTNSHDNSTLLRLDHCT